MRRWAFVIAILGMAIMLFLMNLPAREVVDYEGIADLEVNTRVQISGEVINERIIYGDEKLLVLGNGTGGELELVYQGDGRFNEKKIEAVGFVSEYDGKKQITVERIMVLG
jgi:hypothetical protein